jgi:hypothetical protein
MSEMGVGVWTKNNTSILNHPLTCTRTHQLCTYSYKWRTVWLGRLINNDDSHWRMEHNTSKKRIYAERKKNITFFIGVVSSIFHVILTNPIPHFHRVNCLYSSQRFFQLRSFVYANFLLSLEWTVISMFSTDIKTNICSY